MKTTLAKLLTLCLALALVASAVAEDKADKKKKKKDPVAAAVSFPKKIELTEEQKAKLAELKNEHGEAFAAAVKKVAEAAKVDKKTARKELGKLRKEINAKKMEILTEEQKAALKKKKKKKTDK